MSTLRRILLPSVLAGLLAGCVYADPYPGQGYGYSSQPSYGYGSGPSYSMGLGYNGGYGGGYGYSGGYGGGDGDWHHHHHNWQGWGD